MTTRTVLTDDGSVRMSLPSPVWTGEINIGTGVTLDAVYVGPRTKKVVIKTYSIWQDTVADDGSNVGCRYRLVESDDDLAHLCTHDSDIENALDDVIQAQEL